jgi:inositol 1,4,5-triphosphate receptor type 1
VKKFLKESQAEIRSTMSVNTTEMASAGKNNLHDSRREIKENNPYEMKMKHQRIM